MHLIEEVRLAFDEAAGHDDGLGIEDVEDVCQSFGEMFGKDAIGRAGCGVAGDGKGCDEAGEGGIVASRKSFWDKDAIFLDEGSG